MVHMGDCAQVATQDQRHDYSKTRAHDLPQIMNAPPQRTGHSAEPHTPAWLVSLLAQIRVPRPSVPCNP